MTLDPMAFVGATVADTEARIESYAESAFDRLDARYMRGDLTDEEYNRLCAAISRQLDGLYELLGL